MWLFHTPVIYQLSILFSFIFVWFVLSLVRRRKLREQYSLMWIVLGLIIVSVSVQSHWLNALADALGIYYAPSLLFLIALLFCLAYLLHLTVALSKLSDRVVRLTQELSIYQHQHPYAAPEDAPAPLWSVSDGEENASDPNTPPTPSPLEKRRFPLPPAGAESAENGLDS